MFRGKLLIPFAMSNVAKGSAKNQPKVRAGVQQPEIVDTVTVKLSSIGDRNRTTNKRAYRLNAPYKHDLMLKETGALVMFESASRELTRAAKATAENISVAAAQGQVSLEINIVKTIKGETYLKSGNAGANGETYVAGENIAELQDGDAIHKAEIAAIVITKKGQAIIAAELEKDKMRNKLLRNPAVRSQVVSQLFGINIGNDATAAKDTAANGNDALADEPVTTEDDAE